MNRKYGESEMWQIRIRTALAGTLALIVCLGLLLPIHNATAADPKRRVDFDHLRTGFPLTGAHNQAPCETCHVSGVFRGTPTQCAVCHIAGSRIATTAKPANHIPTFAPCDECHTSTAIWAGARFRHTSVAPGSCTNCHNGSMVQGKPGNHMLTAAACDTCHRTTAWTPARFNHASVMPGSCATCHYTGGPATGKPSNHVQTTAACDTCHKTTAWLPATFSHATVAPGSCATCHYTGGPATGKSSGHFVTSRSCDACHTTTAWIPVTRYTHTSPYYSTHNAGVTCLGCHKGNNEVISWPFAAYKPDCAGCHAGTFKQTAHKKTESPTTIFYTVGELKNCAGSCHLYTNNTFTTIKTTVNSKHRSTDGGF